MTTLMILKRSLRTASNRAIFSVASRQPLVVSGAAITTQICASPLQYAYPANNNSLTLVRYVSSSSTFNTEKLTLLTRQVLETTGPLSDKAWAGAETAFDLWTSPPVSYQGAEWAWHLLDRLVASEQQQGMPDKRQRLTNGWVHRLVSVYIETDVLAVDPTMILQKLETYQPVLTVDDKTRTLLESIEYRAVLVNGQEQSMNLSLKSVWVESKSKVASSQGNAVSKHVDDVASSPPPDITIPKQSTSVIIENEQDKPIEQAMFNVNKPIGSMNASDWKRAQHASSHASSCEHAFMLLDRLIQEDSQRVTTEWLNSLVQQWMEQGTMPPSELLVKLSDYAPLPDASTYEVIVAAIKKTFVLNPRVGSLSDADWERAQAELVKLTNLESPVTSERIESAWTILDRLVEEDKYGMEQSDAYKSRLHPDWLNRIVEAWCRCPSEQEDATDILVRINRYAPEMTPDPYIYQLIVDATVSKKTQDTKRNVQTEKQQMRSPAGSSRKQERTVRTHDKRKGTTSDAPTVTRESPDMTHNASPSHVSTTKTYNSKLWHLTKKETGGDPDSALGILNEMWELYHAGNVSVKPNTGTYNLVLKVIAKSRQRQSGVRAEGLLRRMQKLHDAGDTTVKPDLTSFTTCITAWSSTGDTVAAERAMSLLNLLQEMYQAGDASLKPDSFTYKALLKALSRAANERLGEIAESVLLKMQKFHENGDTDVKPDTTCYNLVMKAISKSYGLDKVARAERVESMLDSMEKHFASGKVSLKPNLLSYQMAIYAWSKCHNNPNSGDRAEHLLERLETVLQVKPSRQIYNAVIVAHARSGAAEKAERVLERMEHANSCTSSNETSYSMILAVYARRGSEEASLRAEALFNRMLKSDDAGNSSAKPDPSMYSKMALAWLNSKSDNAIDNTIRYLEELKKLRHPKAKREFEITYANIVKSLSMYEEESLEHHKLKERIEGLRTDQAGTVSLSSGERSVEPKETLEERETAPQGEGNVHTSSSTNDTALTTSLA